jgi:hypothetical protein
MRRLLTTAIFLLGMSLFGFGISIISSIAATPAPVELTAQPSPPIEETPTTVALDPAPTTTGPVELQPAKRIPAVRKPVQLITATSIVR